MNHKKRRTQVNSRILCVYIVFFAGITFLAGRILYLKVVHGAEYEKNAAVQQINRYDSLISPERGNILDRNMQALGLSIPVYNVILDPLVLLDEYKSPEKNKENQAKTIKAISEVIGLTEEELWVHFELDSNGNLVKPTHYVRVAKTVPRAEADALKSRVKEEELKGVWLEEDTKRTYPLNVTASNIIGFIRGDTKLGLERSYDHAMKGENGRTFLIYENNRTPITQQIPAINGNSIVTYIDHTIQQYAEEALILGVEEHQPERAAILAMNPSTGEVIAMATYPTFNANDPTTPIYLEDPEFAQMWANLTEEERLDWNNSVWNNYLISSSFQPGSIFKPIFMAAALDSGIVTVEDEFYCGGHLELYGIRISCHKKTGHGWQSFEEALANSCNVAMMEIVEEMGPELFEQYFIDFGYGQKTDIDLPGELNTKSSTGLVYNLAQFRNPINLANSSFGQGFNATPIQSAIAFNAVINGGALMRPQVVSHIIDRDGNIVQENNPKMMRRVISQETSDIMRTFLQSVVDEGTGQGLKIEGYTIGGKTGTGQQRGADGTYDDNLHTVSFIAYLPVEDPQFMAFAILDKPAHYEDGRTSAAPMLKVFLENCINYLGIERTQQAEEEQAVNPEDVVLENFIGQDIRIVTEKLYNLNLNYNLIGKGSVVTNQWPQAKVPVPEGANITLYVTSQEGEEEMNAIPDVVGLIYEDACTVLIQAGFSPQIIGFKDQDDMRQLDGKTVVRQSPGGGIYAVLNAEVSIELGEKKENSE